MPETTTTETTEPDTAGLERSDTVVEATPEAHEFVDRLTNRLDLWETEVDAALFLASIAVAHDADPVPEAELADERTEIGDLADAEGGTDGEADPLTLFAFLDDPDRAVETVLEETLPGWIEAGKDLVEPELSGANAVGAPAAIAELIEDAS